MHVENIAFANTRFLSTWVFDSQEWEEHMNAKKHAQIKVRSHENVQLQCYYVTIT
jgi:hypothetical protein